VRDLDEYERQVLLAAVDYAALGIRPTIDLLHEAGLGSRARVGLALRRLEAAGYLLREKWSEPDGSWTHDTAVSEVSGLC